MKSEEKQDVVAKKVVPFWMWLILLLALSAVGFLLYQMYNSKPKVVEKVVTNTEVVTKTETITKIDTVFLKEIEEIETKFNSVQFAAGKYDIPETAKFALYDLSKILVKQPNLKLKVEGHTSKEGDSKINQKLSEKRALAVVEFLISQGADSTRLSYQGLGSSKPIDTENLDKNRRTEFIIIEK